MGQLSSKYMKQIYFDQVRIYLKGIYDDQLLLIEVQAHEARSI
jgi:hypothetical protein